MIVFDVEARELPVELSKDEIAARCGTGRRLGRGIRPGAGQVCIVGIERQRGRRHPAAVTASETSVVSSRASSRILQTGKPGQGVVRVD